MWQLNDMWPVTSWAVTDGVERAAMRKDIAVGPFETVEAELPAEISTPDEAANELIVVSLGQARGRGSLPLLVTQRSRLRI